ncbi:putative GTP pyrophosphokinase [Halanaerobium saccharolyticum]|jgi:putative GTP pyrophosphokinase|uniref:Putative GTP pyrophosphokinase n=1 Tax=Halanaerobium saccharolyticum TaxID=43595 RepID=A0A2T5RFL0_9FIRM|nr:MULTISPECIES: GTP pyrophosphokinase family protein [Halanaerobium]OEG61844.1 MAG: GTP pyrophosphokinase [Halanaerobium sp. MDAL1]PTV93113.1 putative GTP pyrophosphokinase [Halanaerobium saccharolyticum]PUU92440.1 MAG: RelA/SpoT domain-containing protein [Halanaerobium sp.]
MESNINKEQLMNIADQYGFKEWRELIFIHESAIEEVNTKLKILNNEFKIIHDHNPIEHIKTRVKKPDSIIEKLERKGYEVNIENAKTKINDIAGIRIICSFTDDIYKILEMIKSQDDIEVLKVKDYIKNPKENGYRSLHLLIQLPIFLSSQARMTKVEIQTRTIAMDFWASLEHKIYYKYKNDAPDEIPEKLKESAEMIKKLDQQMLDIKKELDQYAALE